MISPFAPLYPWLRDALGHQVVRSSAGLPRFASSHYPTPYEIDLRDLQTRTAVLRALHDAGHSRPWALGAPWSPLTDEQAGRATAEILRAVGEDPSRPIGMVPDRILSEWFTPEDGDKPPRHYRHGSALVWREVVIGSDHSGRYVCVCQNAWIADLPWDGETPYTGPETGDAGRLAADNAARTLGCLMLEDLTPT